MFARVDPTFLVSKEPHQFSPEDLAVMRHAFKAICREQVISATTENQRLLLAKAVVAAYDSALSEEELVAAALDLAGRQAMAFSDASAQFDGSGWNAAKPDHPHERMWQFRVADGKEHSAFNGIDYFEKRARELAAAIGCRLVAMKNVKLELSRAKVWMVTGTAVLENPRENISAALKS